MTTLSPDNPAAQAGPTPGDRSGLSTAEARRRLAQVGPNEVETGRRFHLLRTAIGFLTSPLVLILLVASVVSGILGEPLNAAIIALMVLLSVVLDFAQVFRSEQAARAARASTSTRERR